MAEGTVKWFSEKKAMDLLKPEIRRRFSSTKQTSSSMDSLEFKKTTAYLMK